MLTDIYDKGITVIKAKVPLDYDFRLYGDGAAKLKAKLAHDLARKLVDEDVIGYSVEECDPDDLARERCVVAKIIVVPAGDSSVLERIAQEQRTVDFMTSIMRPGNVHERPEPGGESNG